MLQRARQLLFALLALTLAGAAPALAGGPDYGTPAFSNQELRLFEGPGRAYATIGRIPADQAVTVYRCTVLFCAVGLGHQRGWTFIAALNFGLSSAGPLSGPRLNYGSGGPGEVCFFEGPNYTGASVCMGPGRVYKDLLLAHLDDRFSSVTVSGDVSAAVCRDRDFQSYCTRIIHSEPILSRYLNDNVSSIQVY